MSISQVASILSLPPSAKAGGSVRGVWAGLLQYCNRTGCPRIPMTEALGQLELKLEGG